MERHFLYSYFVPHAYLCRKKFYLSFGIHSVVVCTRLFIVFVKKVVHTRTYVRSLRHQVRQSCKITVKQTVEREHTHKYTDAKNQAWVLGLCVWGSSIVADAVLIFLFHFFFLVLYSLTFLSRPDFFYLIWTVFFSTLFFLPPFQFRMKKHRFMKMLVNGSINWT